MVETISSPAAASVVSVSVSAACPDASASPADAAFERGNALLENVGRRIHDARVDVAEFLQGEQARSVVGVVEDIRGGLVDGHGAGSGRGVDLLPGVNGESGEVLFRCFL